MNPKEEIDILTTKFISFFKNELEHCENDISYINLIISVFVFNNLINDHYEKIFKKDNPDEIEFKKTIKFLQDYASDITKEILSRVQEDKFKIFN